MQIQRIQSVFLLLGAVLMALISFVIPVAGSVDPVDGAIAVLYVSDLPELLIINLLSALLMLIAIFLFKNLDFQMKVTRMCIVLTITSALLEGYILLTMPDTFIPYWLGSSLMLCGALIMNILALYCMGKDKKLLNSYNRLR